MSIKESIRAQFLKDFGSKINTSGTEFCALVTNEKYTGTLEKILKTAADYGSSYTDNPSIYDQSGTMLAKSVKFFTFLEQFTNESEDSLKNRISAIFIRNGDTAWGTPRNIINVFKQYFDIDTVFIAENTSEEDEILDGDFADESAWTFVNCERTTEARFSKTYGVTLNNNSLLSQTVSDLTASKPYFLHFFMKNSVGVKIMNNSGYYWNYSEKAWQSDEVINYFSSTDWKNQSMFIINDSDTTEYTITFTSSSSGFIDYIRMNEKLAYPTFTVIAQFEGESTSNVLALAPGTSDPVEGKNEDLYGYYNQAYLTGVATGFASDVYQDLLDILRPTGVKAFIEIVSKDYITE